MSESPRVVLPVRVPADAQAEPLARVLFADGVEGLRTGRHADSEAAFSRVLRLLPAHATSWLNVGLLRHRRGAARDGLRCVLRALALDAAKTRTGDLPLSRLFADAHAAAQAAGDAAAADGIARLWVHHLPDDPRAVGAAAMAALGRGDTAQAHAVLDRTPTRAADATLSHARALLALQAGTPAAAQRDVRTALTLAPTYADAWATLGTLILRHRDGEGAAPALLRALHLAPGHPGALLALASLRLSEGAAAEAAALALQVPAAVRRDPAHIGDLLSILHHAPGIDPDTIRMERDGWAPRTGLWRPDLPAPAAPPPFRIAYVGDLTRPQVAALALPAILAHDRTSASGAVEAHLVHASPPDRPPAPPPAGLERQRLHVVPDSTPEALRKAVRAIAPHVLVLLTPTTLPQALQALAERLAPVQVMWGDVFGSLGLPGLDALLTDAHHVPGPGRISEAAVCLPHGAYFFSPPADAPDPGPPPCLSAGAITFGSFNRLDKINDPLLARWGRVLAAVPDARLLIQARALGRAAVRDALTERLGRAGVPAARVDLAGGRDRAGMMDLYRTVDIALDSAPWSGGLTVLELLWMGVPVVTLAGDHPCGRHAVSHLTRAGLADWIAADADAYEARAVAGAADRDALARLRGALRPHLAALPLCDPAAYAAQLEDACRALWADHAVGRRPGSRSV